MIEWNLHRQRYTTAFQFLGAERENTGQMKQDLKSLETGNMLDLS